MANLILFALLIALTWFLLLRPAVNSAAPGPTIPARGLTGLVQRIEGYWAHSGQTAKRWACVVAGAGLMLAAQTLLHVLIP